MRFVNQKGLAPIILISGIIVGLILIFGWIFIYLKHGSEKTVLEPENNLPKQTVSSSPLDGLASWKSYSNEKLGYSLKYPSNWYVYSFKDYPYEGYPGIINPEVIIVTSNPKFPKFLTDGSDQYIGFQISKNDNIDQYVQTRRNYQYPSGEKDKVEELVLNGFKVSKLTNLDGDVTWNIPYKKTKESGIVILILANSIQSVDNSKIDSILNTFKLSDDSDEILSWKTYKGETSYTSDGSSAFTIKYPSNWEVEKNFLYPFGKPKPEEPFNSKPIITLGAGGHGAPDPQQNKGFPGGSARYYWDTNENGAGGYATFVINNKFYIFEAQNIPVKESKNIEAIFNKMLETFQNNPNLPRISPDGS